jgi:hypothetical protein
VKYMMRPLAISKMAYSSREGAYTRPADARKECLLHS